jgi:hypothetical protein
LRDNVEAGVTVEETFRQLGRYAAMLGRRARRIEEGRAGWLRLELCGMYRIRLAVHTAGPSDSRHFDATRV